MKLKKIMLLAVMVALPSIGLSEFDQKKIETLNEMAGVSGCTFKHKSIKDFKKVNNDSSIIYLKTTNFDENNTVTFRAVGNIKDMINEQGKENIKDCLKQTSIEKTEYNKNITYCDITNMFIPNAFLNEYTTVDSTVVAIDDNYNKYTKYTKYIVSTEPNNLVYHLKPFHDAIKMPQDKRCDSYEVITNKLKKE